MLSHCLDKKQTGIKKHFKMKLCSSPNIFVSFIRLHDCICIQYSEFDLTDPILIQ